MRALRSLAWWIDRHVRVGEADDAVDAPTARRTSRALVRRWPARRPILPASPHMALVDQEQLATQECVRVYTAGRLREAKRVEEILTTNGVDYFVAIERFERLLFGIIRREYDGVSFYVPDALAAHCRVWLREAKLIAGIEEAESGPRAGS